MSTSLPPSLPPPPSLSPPFLPLSPLVFAAGYFKPIHDGLLYKQWRSWVFIDGRAYLTKGVSTSTIVK